MQLLSHRGLVQGVLHLLQLGLPDLLSLEAFKVDSDLVYLLNQVLGVCSGSEMLNPLPRKLQLLKLLQTTLYLPLLVASPISDRNPKPMGLLVPPASLKNGVHFLYFHHSSLQPDNKFQKKLPAVLIENGYMNFLHMTF